MAGDLSRFSEPVFINPKNLTPEKRADLAKVTEAWRRAHNGDKSLAIQLGLFPDPEKEDR